jgi:hypothetical protein
MRKPAPTAAVLPALCLAATLGGEGPAHAAFGYSQNWINNWSVCEDTSPATLQYTDDKIAYWASAMQALGNVRVRYYAQQDVWASDLVDDRDFRGQDHLYSDKTDISAPPSTTCRSSGLAARSRCI